MRIDQTDPVICSHIADDHITQEYGFTCTCLSDDVYMSKFIFLFDSESDLFSSIIGIPNDGEIAFLCIFCGWEIDGIGEFLVYAIVQSFDEVFFDRDMEKVIGLRMCQPIIFLIFPDPEFPIGDERSISRSDIEFQLLCEIRIFGKYLVREGSKNFWFLFSFGFLFSVLSLFLGSSSDLIESRENIGQCPWMSKGIAKV